MNDSIPHLKIASLTRPAILFVLALFFAACTQPDEYGPVDLPIEKATIRELRLPWSSDAAGADYALASFQGSKDEPCIGFDIGRKDAAAGVDFSAFLLGFGKSSAWPSPEGGYSISLWPRDYRLLGRAGAEIFDEKAEAYAQIVAPFGEGRFLVLGSDETLSYSASAAGKELLAKISTSSLTGDERFLRSACALPGGGYAASASDPYLRNQKEVLSFIGTALNVLGGSIQHSLSFECLGAESSDALIALSIPDGSEEGGFFYLTRFARGSTLQERIEGSLPTVFPSYGHSSCWAGDRFWLVSGSTLMNIAAADGEVSSVHETAFQMGYAGEYSFRGLPDGGILLFGPMEPVRSGSRDASPPYGKATLRVMRYDADFELVWEREWAPSSASRILAAVGDASGLSVLVCER